MDDPNPNAEYPAGRPTDDVIHLLSTGAVRVLSCDGWRCRALVREGREILTVAYDRGRWSCSCSEQAACAHACAVASVVRVLP
jgi:hypothetical protein